LGFFVIELLGRTLFRALKQDHGVFDLVSVRILVPETLTPEDPDDSFRFDLETGLLLDFPNDGLRRVLSLQPANSKFRRVFSERGPVRFHPE
jgi:hypothetical protein